MPCTLSLLSGWKKKPTVQILPQTSGIYDPDFLATHEDKRKGVRHVTPLFLPPINGHEWPQIFRRDLVCRSILIPTLLLRDFKRVIPPHTGFLRLAHSSPFSRFLVNLSKEEISMKRSIPGYSWIQIRETNSRERTGDMTWFNLCIIRFIYQHKPSAIFLL